MTSSHASSRSRISLSRALPFVLVLAVGCGGGASPGAEPNAGAASTPDAGAPTPPITPNDGDAASPATGFGDAAAPAVTCADDASKYIYLLTSNAAIYRFAPATLAIDRLGEPACVTAASTLAIDHLGRAWTTTFTAGATHLVRIDLPGLGCTDVGALTTAAPGNVAEIAFAGTSPQTESLYAILSSSAHVMAVDLAARSVGSDAGGFVVPILTGSLTGTGDGHLYALVNTTANGTSLQALTPGAGAAAAVPMPFLTEDKDQPMAFWGGDLWVFPYFASGNATTVVQYRPSAGTATTAVPSIRDAIGNASVAGAAVSTCAPLAPPR